MSRSLLGRTSFVLGVVSLMGLSAPLAASAFAPKEWHEAFGAIGKSHSRQTADAIREVILQVYKSPTVSRTSERAIEEIAAGDAAVDADDRKDVGKHHFDGEQFVQAQAVIAAAIKDVVYGLKNNRVDAARWKLGGALHTLQDFYSHSNWIENGNTVPHVAVGREATIGDTASIQDDTCVDCIIVKNDCQNCSKDLTTRLLTSGYYGGQSDVTRPRGPAKCSHGGSKDSEATNVDLESATTSGINKDTKFCSLSPHSNLHATAAQVAMAASKQLLLDLKAKVTEVEFMQLLGIGPSVAVVLDTSGSMESVWKALGDHMEKLIAARVGTVDEFSKFVYAPFSDPFVGTPTVTSNPKTFVGAIRGTSVSRGDDCPELSMAGLEKAINASDLGGSVFLFTDADAKDEQRANTVIATARQRGVALFLTSLGSCDGQNAAMVPVAPSPLHRRIARETGGEAFASTKDNVGQVMNTIDELSRGGSTPLAKAVRPAVAVSKNKALGAPLPIQVDDTITRLAVIVSGSGDVRVLRPNGTEVAAGDRGFERLSFENGVIFRFSAPEAGTWSVINASGEVNISIHADSRLGLSSAAFVESSGQGPHDGYFAVAGQPVVGKPQKVAVRVDGPVANCTLELRDEQGELLAKGDLKGDADAPGEFFGEIVPPAQPFVFHVTGTTLQGQAFQRSLQRAEQAQYLHVDAPWGIEAFPSQKVEYKFRLRNDGPSDSFEVELSDEAGFLTSASKQTIELAAGQTTDVTVQLTIGAKAELTSFHRLALRATSKSNSALSTSTVVSTMVVPRSDEDGDSVFDDADNCPATPNSNQANADADKQGDACEPRADEPGCSARVAASGSQWLLGLGLMLVASLVGRRRRG